MYSAASLLTTERLILERQHNKEIAEKARRDIESSKASAPQHARQEVSTTTSLNVGDAEGWVTLEEHLIFIGWSKYQPIPVAKEYKKNIERLVAEAALLKGQTHVEIRGGIHKQSSEGTRIRPEIVGYDRHLTVFFPKLSRRAHVYIGPPDEPKDYKKLRIWRREGKPAVPEAQLPCISIGISKSMVEALRDARMLVFEDDHIVKRMSVVDSR
ncbi:hypothetical protein BDZ45DRAFT_746486 [Acephala macrosclerotiorum]|nr:hypothetical protein BDZ45DRAFT_746486 [Acephala macrosclerotiorum]